MPARHPQPTKDLALYAVDLGMGVKETAALYGVGERTLHEWLAEVKNRDKERWIWGTHCEGISDTAVLKIIQLLTGAKTHGIRHWVTVSEAKWVSRINAAQPGLPPLTTWVLANSLARAGDRADDVSGLTYWIAGADRWIKWDRSGIAGVLDAKIRHWPELPFIVPGDLLPIDGASRRTDTLRRELMGIAKLVSEQLRPSSFVDDSLERERAAIRSDFVCHHSLGLVSRGSIMLTPDGTPHVELMNTIQGYGSYVR